MDLLKRYHKRALVIIITNFRDEDSSELGYALRLLRSRHLVMLASLRDKSKPRNFQSIVDRRALVTKARVWCSTSTCCVMA